MAERKKADEKDSESESGGDVWIINDHDTVVHVSEKEFTERFKSAGYRRLKDGEPAPVQLHEVDKYGTSEPILVMAHRKDAARPESPTTESDR